MDEIGESLASIGFQWGCLREEEARPRDINVIITG